ncbi:MAG TPA: type II toxin-antitoxin system prevent-host-death family antitoxin [Bryobacteraceae bacterium]|nr:type II toxin-antitoxin system prevent-host-death family antitoxin [Bryobacteraceae bacterium]
MAITVSMSEAKFSFSQPVKRAESGEDILIARNGMPVARITRLKTSRPKSPWGALHGKMPDDWDAPLECMKDYL